ncbi:membrane protein insertion efficiency factor YidD [Wolinella succinogenes]|uniref:membrane protein insertion efficiency factor YidD n=1 Tax=Wolinella succinogenes TaxID=844 RepID=UPI002FC767B3
MRTLLIGMIWVYQKVISPLKRPTCRYYPSCSEYALWLFSYSNFWHALLFSLRRILRCNSLFEGGIDYPIISKRITPIFGSPRLIKVWLVPLCPQKDWSAKGKFYLIKSMKVVQC